MKFRPKRSDAEFCGNPCRQAFYRTHKKNVARESAEAAFKSLEHRQSELMRASFVEWYEDRLRNPPTSVILEELRSPWEPISSSFNADNLLFEATADGKILAVETRPGALAEASEIGTITNIETQQALAMLPPPPPPPKIPPRWRRITCDHLIRENHSEHGGVRDFRRMASAGRRIALITWDAEFLERRYQQRRKPDPWPMPRSIGPHLATDFGYEYDDDYDSDLGYVGETGEELLAGGGFHVESK